MRSLIVRINATKALEEGPVVVRGWDQVGKALRVLAKSHHQTQEVNEVSHRFIASVITEAQESLKFNNQWSQRYDTRGHARNQFRGAQFGEIEVRVSMLKKYEKEPILGLSLTQPLSSQNPNLEEFVADQLQAPQAIVRGIVTVRVDDVTADFFNPIRTEIEKEVKKIFTNGIIPVFSGQYHGKTHGTIYIDLRRRDGLPIFHPTEKEELEKGISILLDMLSDLDS